MKWDGSIVRLRTEIGIGTAFRVGPGLYLTAAHCVFDAEANTAQDSILLEYSGMYLDAELIWTDPELDAALLAVRGTESLPRPLPGPRLGFLPTDRTFNGIYWSSVGFAIGDAEGRPLTMTGTVAGLSERPIARLQLTCDQYGSDVQALRGCSGAPIWVNGHIVALLSRMPKVFRDRVLYASPLDAILRRAVLAIRQDSRCDCLHAEGVLSRVALDGSDVALSKLLVRIRACSHY